MITLTVISFNGRPGDGSLSAGFDELGGSIGRADTNQLVLPDPERSISRVHAQVAFRNGRYAVIDQGSNPVSVNGRPLGQGKEAPIAVGDQLQIGGYLIEVRAGGSGKRTVDDPFADLLGPSAAPPAGAAAPAALFDPLAGFGAPPAPSRGAAPAPFADPFAALAPPPPAPRAAPAASLSIPDDWDPFAAPAPASAQASSPTRGRPGGFGAATAGQGARNLGLDLGAAAPAPLLPDMAGDPGSDNASLDALFGLSAGAVGDPLANSALDAPIAQPNMAAAANPMQALNSAPRASAATLQDQLSDLQRPFDARIAGAASPVPAPVPARPAAAAPVTPPAAVQKPSSVVLSWDDAPATAAPPGAVARPVAAPGTPAPPPPAEPLSASPSALPAASPIASPIGSPGTWPDASPSPVRAAAQPVARSPAAPSAAPAAQVAAAPAVVAAPPTAPQGEQVAALLAAFREGLGVPTVQLDALTPELMRLIGELLHEATRGTVDLLIARAALKREVRAEATMIVARENNPLKFSPSVESALGHLLAPPTRGFMAAGPAMRDAFDDLRAHQIGFLAGMRAALEGLLENFDPARLEGRLEKSSGLKALLSGSRQARSWEVFTQRYAELRAEAQDDFHSLFGKAFLKAYEAHIDQLKSESR